MKRVSRKPDPDPSDMPSNVDFSRAVQGKYAPMFSGNVKVVILEPEVAKIFPDAGSVNRALRSLVPARKRKMA